MGTLCSGQKNDLQSPQSPNQQVEQQEFTIQINEIVVNLAVAQKSDTFGCELMVHFFEETIDNDSNCILWKMQTNSLLIITEATQGKSIKKELIFVESISPKNIIIADVEKKNQTEKDSTFDSQQSQQQQQNFDQFLAQYLSKIGLHTSVNDFQSEFVNPLQIYISAKLKNNPSELISLNEIFGIIKKKVEECHQRALLQIKIIFSFPNYSQLSDGSTESEIQSLKTILLDSARILLESLAFQHLFATVQIASQDVSQFLTKQLGISSIQQQQYDLFNQMTQSALAFSNMLKTVSFDFDFNVLHRNFAIFEMVQSTFVSVLSQCKIIQLMQQLGEMVEGLELGLHEFIKNCSNSCEAKYQIIFEQIMAISASIHNIVQFDNLSLQSDYPQFLENLEAFGKIQKEIKQLENEIPKVKQLRAQFTEISAKGQLKIMQAELDLRNFLIGIQHKIADNSLDFAIRQQLSDALANILKQLKKHSLVTDFTFSPIQSPISDSPNTKQQEDQCKFEQQEKVPSNQEYKLRIDAIHQEEIKQNDDINLSQANDFSNGKKDEILQQQSSQQDVVLLQEKSGNIILPEILNGQPEQVHNIDCIVENDKLQPGQALSNIDQGNIIIQQENEAQHMERNKIGEPNPIDNQNHMQNQELQSQDQNKLIQNESQEVTNQKQMIQDGSFNPQEKDTPSKRDIQEDTAIEGSSSQKKKEILYFYKDSANNGKNQRQSNNKQKQKDNSGRKPKSNRNSNYKKQDSHKGATIQYEYIQKQDQP